MQIHPDHPDHAALTCTNAGPANPDHPDRQPDHLRGAAQKVAAVSTAYARSADALSAAYPTLLPLSGHYRIGTPLLAARGPFRPRACA